jgi:hypothetical protein
MPSALTPTWSSKASPIVRLRLPATSTSLFGLRKVLKKSVLTQSMPITLSAPILRMRLMKARQMIQVTIQIQIQMTLTMTKVQATKQNYILTRQLMKVRWTYASNHALMF